MKKNIFYLMCGLLSFSMLFTACSSDDPIIPEFPSEVSEVLVSNGTKTITINPNVDWSIELSNKTDFYIKDGNNEVYTMRGVAGEYTITIGAREVVDFDEDHTCDVTMTMQNDVKTIAKFTVNKIARVLKVYSAQVNENGSFVKEAGKYVYTAEPVESISFVDVWGEYIAPVKVVSNFAFNVVGPEWMTPSEGGEANSEVELVFSADANNLPSADATADVQFIDANKQDKVGATISLSIVGSSNVISIAFDENVFFSYDGEDEPAVGYITSDKDADFVAVATDGSEASWVTIEASWDNEGTSIQEREVYISASANEGATSRVAYVFALPAAKAVENVADLVADGVVKEEYADYLVTTVTQHSEPATISANFVDDTCTTFAEAGSNIDYWFTEGALRDYYIGSKYDISYFGEWAMYGSDSSFKTSRPIDSFEVYSYNMEGSFVNITETSWVTVDAFYTDEEMSRFRLNTDLSAASAEGSLNLNTNEYEAVVLVKYTDGTYSAIYFHYSEQVAGGNTSGGPEFAYPDYVWMDGTSLVELTEGEWYNVFAEFGVPVYQLTYTSTAPSMSMFKNLPQICMNVMESDWLAYEYGEEFQMITMAESGNGQVGALYFQDGATGAGKFIIVCTLQLGE